MAIHLRVKTAEIRLRDCGTLAMASFDFVRTNLRKVMAKIFYSKSVKRTAKK